MLAKLSDLSSLNNENDFKTAEISFTKIFVEKASDCIKKVKPLIWGFFITNYHSQLYLFLFQTLYFYLYTLLI